MLAKDKLSEVLVVGDENLPGVGGGLQYRRVRAARGGSRRVGRPVAKRAQLLNNLRLNILVCQKSQTHVKKLPRNPPRRAARPWQRSRERRVPLHASGLGGSLLERPLAARVQVPPE